MNAFNDRVQDWIRRADEAARLHLQINPEDSVSQSGRSKASKGSRRSSRSSSSSISSARAKEAARAAELQAEAAAFKKRQLLEEQKFQLRQQQERLTLETEIAKAQVLSKCVSCRRRQAPPCSQKMADLPEDRVTPDKPPFTSVGIDCFGPFLVRRGRSLVKRYGVIFYMSSYSSCSYRNCAQSRHRLVSMNYGHFVP